MSDMGTIAYVIAALVLLLWFNRGMFQTLGMSGTGRWALIWLLIFSAAVAVVQVVGVPDKWTQR